MHKTFHHDLPGEGTRDRTALTACEQGHREQRACKRSSKKRRESQIGDPDPIALRIEGNDLSACNADAALAEEDNRGKDKNRRIDKECDRQRQCGIDCIELNRFSHRMRVLLQFAALYESRVEIQIMRHDSRADDSDRDIKHSRLA